MIILKTVNFGSRKTGLSTVGYILLNPDGTTKQARTTTGVSEQGSTGIYFCNIEFDDDWSGFILWDTGEATPRYATEDFDYRGYGGGAGYAGIIVDNIWTREEKEKVFNRIDKIIAGIEENGNVQTASRIETESKLTEIQNTINKINFDKEIVLIMDKIELSKIDLLSALKNIDDKTAPNLGRAISIVKSNIKECVEKIDKIPAHKDVDIIPIKEAIAGLSKQIDFSIKINAKNLRTEDIEALLKEGGIDVSKLSLKRV